MLLMRCDALLVSRLRSLKAGDGVLRLIRLEGLFCQLYYSGDESDFQISIFKHSTIMQLAFATKHLSLSNNLSR